MIDSCTFKALLLLLLASFLREEGMSFILYQRISYKLKLDVLTLGDLTVPSSSAALSIAIASLSSIE
jgi:hypothetical protein